MLRASAAIAAANTIQITPLNGKMAESEAQFAYNRELEAMIENQNRLRDKYENKIRRLSEMPQKLQTYQDLIDIKISLNLELATYGKLLAGEEERLKHFKSIEQLIFDSGDKICNINVKK